MTQEALELVSKIEANGGRIAIKGEHLVIVPRQAGMPLLPKLRAFKPQIIALLQGRSEPRNEANHDPDMWREVFARWKSEKCAQREGRDDWGGIGCLWVDFCEWAVSHNSIRCERRTFERLLADDGFRCVDGMVAGLVFRSDLG